MAPAPVPSRGVVRNPLPAVLTSSPAGEGVSGRCSAAGRVPSPLLPTLPRSHRSDGSNGRVGGTVLSAQATLPPHTSPSSPSGSCPMLADHPSALACRSPPHSRVGAALAERSTGQLPAAGNLDLPPASWPVGWCCDWRGNARPSPRAGSARPPLQTRSERRAGWPWPASKLLSLRSGLPISLW